MPQQDAVPQHDPTTDPLDSDFGKSAPSPQPAPPQATEDNRPRRRDGTFAPRHPSFLVSQAKELGYTDEDLAEMSETSLARVVNQHLHERLAFREQMERARSFEPQQQQPSTPQPAEDDDDGIDLEGAEDLHPAIVKAFKEQAKRSKTLEKHLADRDARDQQQRVQMNADLIDAAFEALADPRFGTGSAADIKGTPEMRRRLAVLQAAGVDINNVSAAKIQRQIKEGHELLYGAEPVPKGKKKGPANPYDQQDDAPPQPRRGRNGWDEGALATPTQRHGDDLPFGEERAVRNLERRMREEGRAVSSGEQAEILDGLPG